MKLSDKISAIEWSFTYVFNYKTGTDWKIMLIILELQSWKKPHGSLSPAPVKEAQWRIELPTIPKLLIYPADLVRSSQLHLAQIFT